MKENRMKDQRTNSMNRMNREEENKTKNKTKKKKISFQEDWKSKSITINKIIYWFDINEMGFLILDSYFLFLNILNLT